MSARLTAEDHRLRAITEKQFQSTVEGLLTAYGWRWYHPVDNKPRNGFIQNVKAGFPDLVAVRGRRILFAELKREKGKVSEAQRDWLADLEAAGVEVFVWRPSDLGEIREIVR